MIEFDHVTKEYDSIKALEDFSAVIEDGEFVFLIGASGAGKSTFIRLLLRELMPSEGHIRVAGQDLAELKNSQIPAYRRTIGMVFQDFKLIPSLNVRENVAFALRVTGAGQDRIRGRVREVLDQVGLGAREEAFPRELSGGEQQRVSIARALANQPRILIADEPTGNLDPDTSREIMQILEQVNGQGTTVIIATHARDIVDEMGRRVLAFDRGNLVRDERKGRYTADE